MVRVEKSKKGCLPRCFGSVFELRYRVWYAKEVHRMDGVFLSGIILMNKIFKALAKYYILRLNRSKSK